MGKQIRFYMLPKDRDEFLRFLERDLDTKPIQATSSLSQLDSFRDVAAQNYYGFRIVLLENQRFLVRENDIKQVDIKEYDENERAYVTTGRIEYYIDASSSNVVEFKQSFFREGEVLAKGRIWAEMYRLENGELVYKGDEFNAWYNKMAQWIRSKFKESGGIDGYFGPAAYKWYQQGGRISDH